MTGDSMSYMVLSGIHPRNHRALSKDLGIFLHSPPLSLHFQCLVLILFDFLLKNSAVSLLSHSTSLQFTQQDPGVLLYSPPIYSQDTVWGNHQITLPACFLSWIPALYCVWSKTVLYVQKSLFSMSCSDVGLFTMQEQLPQQFNHS